MHLECFDVVSLVKTGQRVENCEICCLVKTYGENLLADMPMHEYMYASSWSSLCGSSVSISLV